MIAAYRRYAVTQICERCGSVSDIGERRYRGRYFRVGSVGGTARMMRALTVEDESRLVSG